MTSRTENVGCCRNSGKRAGRVASNREHRQRTGACVRSRTTAARPESISGHIIQERCRKAADGRCWAASYLGGIARKGLALSGSRQDHPFPAHMPERTDLPTGVRRMRQQKRICMVTSSHCRPKAACSQECPSVRRKEGGVNTMPLRTITPSCLGAGSMTIVCPRCRKTVARQDHCGTYRGGTPWR